MSSADRAVPAPLPAGALEQGRPGGLADALHQSLHEILREVPAGEPGSGLVESVVTTAVVARRTTERTAGSYSRQHDDAVDHR